MKKLLYLLLVTVLFACQGRQREIRNYPVEYFFNNLRITGGVFSPDETRLLVSSDKTGILNLFEINIADGSKTQLTHSTVESYFAIDYVPGTNKVLYRADIGGNEINHIFLLNEDGSSINLTPGEKENTLFFGWSRDKTAMYYLSNKRDPRFFDLKKMTIGEWKPSTIYENIHGYFIDGFSYDENYVVLRKPITTSVNKLFLYNRATSAMTEISSDENPGEYSVSGFSKDGQNFYYTTNTGREFTYLVRYRLETGERETIFEADWDVMFSFLSENEKYRVIGINEDAKNTLIVKNNLTGEKVPFPAIPDGDVLSVSISDSELNMRLTVGTSKAPSNIYVYNFETGDLRKLTETLNPEINPLDLVSAQVVRFKSFDGLEIPAIYYRPHGASRRNRVPALVMVPGGPGGQMRVGYSPLIQYLVNQGYAILAVNNRGAGGYGKTFSRMDDRDHGGADLKDCIWGKKWLQERNYIDPERIGIMGGSYGGFMTMAAMTFHPDAFRVGVNIFGVTNWIRTLRSIPPWWEANRRALFDELGDPFTQDSVRLYNISPLFHAHQVRNPVLVLQGANDPRVLQVESDEIVAAIRENNVHVEYVLFPDEGHSFRKKENEIYAYGRIRKFLDRFLKGVE